ncbi:MAG: glycosyltransferase [Pseudomonadales bacterium]|nr:glycosyltransferase [Pseudomonadales bacterium]
MSLTTIVVSPRERYSSLTYSLKSLLASVDTSVPIVVVDAGSPESVRQDIVKLKLARPFKHIQLDYPLLPNEARNVGAKHVETEYIIFTDNDIEYTPNWLEQLEKSAIQFKTDAVAPLTLIGPSEKKKIHHAGGIIIKTKNKNQLQIKENHRLANQYLIDCEDELKNSDMIFHDVAEFHCMLMRRSAYNAMGGLDESLISQEQIDVGLRFKKLGLRMSFNRESIITYRAFDPFTLEDLQYHLFRWSDRLAKKSVETFNQSWGVNQNIKRIRFMWIRKHRERAIATVFPHSRKMLGKHLFRYFICAYFEWKFDKFETRRRIAFMDV